MDKDLFYISMQAFEKEYVNFDAFAQIFNKLTQTLQLYRKSGVVRNLVVIGESGSGKTSLAQAFRDQYPRQHMLEKTVTPVAYVEVPSIGTIGALARQILVGLGDPFPEKGRVIDQTARIELLIKNSGVEMLILDEAQHVYDRGQNKTQYATADWLKSLLNSIKIPIVLFGIPRLENLLQVNVQLRRRFNAPMVLSLGDLSDSKFSLKTYDVINSLAPVLPLPLSCNEWDSFQLTERIYYATDGRVGYLKELLAQALEIAWEIDERKITRSDLAAAFTNIWSGSVGRLNPFNDDFVFRRLDRAGEPFAVDRVA